MWMKINDTIKSLHDYFNSLLCLLGCYYMGFVVMDGMIVTFGVLTLFIALLLAFVIAQPDLCYSFQGIDHNGNNDPFTIYVGDC